MDRLPGRTETPASGPDSALPPVAARAIAFASIVVAGLCGGLIGFALVDLQAESDSPTVRAVGAFVGAVVAAGGVAVVAVLVLRAMGEWRTIEHGRAGRREGRLLAEDAAPKPRYLPHPEQRRAALARAREDQAALDAAAEQEGEDRPAGRD